MRQIGSLNDEQKAERFTAYLIVEGIPAHVDNEGDEWEIWIKDEDQVEKAQQELEFFKNNPGDGKYAQVIEQAKAQIAEQVEKRKQQLKKVVNVRDSWPKGNQYKAPLTMAIIVVSVVAFFLAGFGDEQRYKSVVFRAFSFTYVPLEVVLENLKPVETDDVVVVDPDSLSLRCASLMRGEVWRVITPVFLHFSPFHIMFNMIMFYQLGRLLEHKYGTAKYALMIVAIAVLSNFFQAVMPAAWDGSEVVRSPDGQYLIHVFGGMSGVVYGLFGFIWMKSTFDRASGFFMQPFNVAILIGWLMLGIFGLDEQLLGFQMANWAHGIGLLVGMAFGYLSSPRR